ncbi:MAG TPA: GNAT family N-acetyltransferase [Thermoleophilaceae bacterium]|nr:GNAT family N-acetyltransferase [Thermoleophilaceae bacterium]
MATISQARPPVMAEQRGRALSGRALESLDRVDPHTWDALVGEGNGPLMHGFLRAWENVELRGLCSRPVVAYATGSAQPMAACPGYFYDLDMPTVRSPKTGPALRALRHLWPDLLYARTYELGSPTPLTNPFLVRDRETRPAAIEALIGAALDEGEREPADFVLVQNFTSRSGPAAEYLAGEGFAGVPIPVTAVLDLPFDSFDDYLGAMRSQYRRRARQALKRSGELRAEHLRDFADLAGDFARLWGAIYQRASEIKREILTPAFFREVSVLDDSSALVMRRPDGSLASFALLLADGRWLSFLQCGFEEEAGRQEGAYFRLLYEIARIGIEGGFEQIDLGMTTITPKLDIGAVPVPLFAWVKHRNPLFQRAIRALARGPLRPPKIEPRRVFKDAPRSAAELVEQREIPS